MLNYNLKSSIAISSVVIFLLLEFSLFNDFFYPFQFLLDENKILELSTSLILFFLSLFGTFFIFFSGRSLFRKITLPFFILFFLFNLGSFNIANAPLDFQQAVIITENFHWWFWAALENYGLAILPGIIVIIPLIIFVERLPELINLNISKKFYFIPIISLMLTTISLHYNNGFFDRYPSFFRIPSMLLFAELSSVYDGKRLGVNYSDSIDPKVEKIILIVDESVRADILGINGYKEDTTPYLNSLETGMVNFGLASSASNCSDYSNLVLRIGVRKKEIPDYEQLSLKKPSIWQFAKKAGFKNIYIDSQSAEEWSNYQNFMNKYEASFIDEIVRTRQKIAYLSDGYASKKLIEYLKRPGKDFIIVNKYGLHFPYFSSYPKKHNIFRPALKYGEAMNDRKKSLNSFMNGLHWSVDGWFKSLLSKSNEFRSYVIIYTSDHGQNIVDDGTLATHCRPKANIFEGIVPMIVFSNDTDILKSFMKVNITNHNKTSHFQIFPTLIKLAGYKNSFQRTNYGASLSEPSDEVAEFFVGDLHGRGSVRQWLSISPAKTD